MASRLSQAYAASILRHPKVVLAVLLALAAFFAYHAKDFQLDASAESLLLEDDLDLKLFREVHARYPSRDLLVVTFTPEADLFSDASIERLASLRDELAAIAGVDSVVSMVDIPLLKNEDLPLLKAIENYRKLTEPDIDRDKAREEIRESPVYRNLILSADARTTAVLINLEEDQELTRALHERNTLRERLRAEGSSESEEEALVRVSAAYDERHKAANADRHRIVEEIRSIMRPYKEHGVLYLGGVPMITDDMVSFVKNDLIVFGSGVLAFLIVVLALIFRDPRWMALPLLSCLYAGLVMVGVLGLIGWKVTVISSNFLALMLIITISMNIHLIVRYKQLSRDFPSHTQLDLVAATTGKMALPCFYTALTTIMGFSSLVISDIKPVIDFGWMMSAGLAVTFLTSFTLLPAVLMVQRRQASTEEREREFRLPDRLATLTELHGGKILAVTVVIAVSSGVGITKLEVENSFINYFREDTEIYQGLELIDRALGGTTPLEVILRLDEGLDSEMSLTEEELAGLSEEEREEFLEIERQMAEEMAKPEYWFTPYKIERIKAAHDYLGGLPEIGKVLSIASVIRVGEDLNKGEEFDSFQLSLLYSQAPEEVKSTMIAPYVSIPHGEARLFARIVDSKEDLRRKDLLERVRRDFVEKLGFERENVTVTGLLVLYNNMLQSLFRSQISTLGVVMVGIAAMFLVLFRSVLLSVIGIVPNLLGALVVLGLMGWMRIPMDMMTITIAAITIGIAVDNGIHYIYRFREEFARNRDYVKTLHLCHSSIGKAVVYTTTTVIFGFSILVLSNFIPTIYFGVLTALAMFIALLAALTLLPKLILMWRPFGPGGAGPSPSS